MATPLVEVLQNAFFRAIIGTSLRLPYRKRVVWAGRVTSRVVAPLAGWRTRIRRNLEHVWPELPQEEREKIVRQVSDNVGRTLIEIYSGKTFIDQISNTDMSGPGMPSLAQARTAKRPIILITAHLGNYDVVRGKLNREGFDLAALYKPMANKYFNAHYVDAISAIGKPVYPTRSHGIVSLLRHLRSGGVIGIVADVASRRAPVLDFFGQPAHTPLSAAEWALKFDALLLPVFGIRQDDGLSFRIEVCEPIAHNTPEAMMQSYNDTVEQFARRYPGQWFWLHRRWKGAHEFAVRPASPAIEAASLQE